MALDNVVNIGVSVSDFKSSIPKFYAVYSAANNQSIPNNALFSEKITSFDLGSTTYGYIEFDITYTGTSDYSSISFGVPNIDILKTSSITYGYNLTDPFDALYSFDPSDIKKTIHSGDSVLLKNNIKQKIYLIVNLIDNFKYNTIQIYTTIGLFNGSAPSVNHNFKIEYNCVVPIYKYDVGLHVYSPYDAIESTARLTTILTSLTPVSSWVAETSTVAGTQVYSDEGFTRPALPYYYGISNKVYKVGGPFNRAYGTKTKFLASQSNFSAFMEESTGGNYWKAKVTEVTMGPSYWEDSFTIEACVSPIMTKVGIITEITLTSKLTKPLRYQYYMGYNLTKKQSSSENFFVKYLWNLATKVPIVGSEHAVEKIMKGYASGIKTSKILNLNLGGTITEFRTPIAVVSAGLLYWGLTSAAGKAAGKFVINGVLQLGTVAWEQFWNILIGPNKPAYTKIVLGGQKLVTSGAGFLNAIGKKILLPLGNILWPIAAFFVGKQVFEWTTENLINKDFVFNEDCTQLFKFKNSNPYIFTGDTIYRQETSFSYSDPFNTTVNLNFGTYETFDGYFCDGVYFYTQTGGTVTVKEVASSNSFDGLYLDDNISTKVKFSMQPDNPTYVVTGYSLMSLPYISGVPIVDPFDNFDFPIFYNIPLSGSFTPDAPGDLESNNIGNVNLDYSLASHFSYNGQSEVDTITTNHLNIIAESVTGTTVDTYNFNEPLTGYSIGNIATIFTHEIKIENTPNDNMIYFDNQDSLGVITGKTFYQDLTGRVKSLDGYYAITGGTYYRTFYEVSGSTVIDIFNMQYSGSTSVTGLTSNTLPVVTDRLDYTSDWYYYDVNKISLLNNVNILFYDKIPNITTLYSQDYIKRGYATTGQTSFYTYTTNVGPTTGTTESLDGCYKPLIGWSQESQNDFSYNVGKTIQIDIEESCSTGLNFVDPLLGFYIVGNVSGSLSPLYDYVRLNTNIYVDTILTQSYGVTSSFSDAKTFIPYTGLTSSDNVTNITITSINVDNLDNKYTYITGSFINCNNI